MGGWWMWLCRARTPEKILIHLYAVLRGEIELRTIFPSGFLINWVSSDGNSNTGWQENSFDLRVFVHQRHCWQRESNNTCLGSLSSGNHYAHYAVPRNKEELWKCEMWHIKNDQIRPESKKECSRKGAVWENVALRSGGGWRLGERIGRMRGRKR